MSTVKTAVFESQFNLFSTPTRITTTEQQLLLLLPHRQKLPPHKNAPAVTTPGSSSSGIQVSDKLRQTTTIAECVEIAFENITIRVEVTPERAAIDIFMAKAKRSSSTELKVNMATT